MPKRLGVRARARPGTAGRQIRGSGGNKRNHERKEAETGSGRRAAKARVAQYARNSTPWAMPTTAKSAKASGSARGKPAPVVIAQLQASAPQLSAQDTVLFDDMNTSSSWWCSHLVNTASSSGAPTRRSRRALISRTWIVPATRPSIQRWDNTRCRLAPASRRCPPCAASAPDGTRLGPDTVTCFRQRGRGAASRR